MLGLVLGVEKATRDSGVTPTLTITDKKENPDPVAARGRSASDGQVGQASSRLIPGLKKVEEIPYTVEVSGNYRQTLDFLTYFENSPFMSELTKLSITADSVQNETTKVLKNTGIATSKVEAVFFIRSQ